MSPAVRVWLIWVGMAMVASGSACRWVRVAGSVRHHASNLGPPRSRPAFMRVGARPPANGKAATDVDAVLAARRPAAGIASPPPPCDSGDRRAAPGRIPASAHQLTRRRRDGPFPLWRPPAQSTSTLAVPLVGRPAVWAAPVHVFRHAGLGHTPWS